MDDAAGPGITQVRHGGARGANGGLQVRAVCRVPDLVGIFTRSRAGVVHQRVQPAEARDRFRHQPLDVSGLRDVRYYAQRLDASFAQLRLCLAQRLLAASADGDAAAFAGEGEGDRTADAAAAAGDDRYLIAQT